MSDQEEKKRIIDLGSRKFFELGVYRVTIDEIAEELGMSKKTIYKYFASKEDLILAIVHERMRRIRDEMTKLLHSSEPFEAKLTSLLLIVGRQIRYITPVFQKDLMRMSPTVWKEIDTFRREQVLGQLSQLFEQGQRDGYFRNDVNIKILQLIIVSAAQNIVNPAVLSEHSFSAVEAFQEIIKTVFAGSLTNEARARIHLFDEQFEKQLAQRTI